MSLTAPVSGMISDRVGSRGPATAGMAIMAAGTMAAAGVVLTAARGDGNGSGDRPARKPATVGKQG